MLLNNLKQFVWKMSCWQKTLDGRSMLRQKQRFLLQIHYSLNTFDSKNVQDREKGRQSGKKISLYKIGEISAVQLFWRNPFFFRIPALPEVKWTDTQTFDNLYII